MNIIAAKRLPQRSLVILVLPFLLQIALGQAAPATWKGTLRDAAGGPVAGAKVALHATAAEIAVRTGSEGAFEFKDIPAGKYAVNVQWNGGSGSVAGVV